MPKPSITLAIMAATVVVTLTGDAFAEANTNLPFNDDFEAYTNGTPLDTGTNGWYGSSANIIVSSNMTIGATGTNSAMIPVDCTLSNRFTGIVPTNVWIQMDLRPRLYDGTNTPLVDTNLAGMFYVNSNGNFVVHNGPASPNATNSTNWVVLSNGGIGTNGTNWVTIGIYQDFNMHRWHLYTNNTLVTNNIIFINQGLTSFAGLDFYNGATTSYLDNVSVTASTNTVLTVGGSFTVSNRMYDATTVAAISNNSLTLVGTNGTEGLTLTAGAVFSNKNVGVGINVSLASSKLEGADAVNYTISWAGAPTTTGDITGAPLASTLIAPITKVYDGTNTATLAPANYALTGLAGSETCTVTQTTGAYATTNVAAGIAVSATLASTDFDGGGSGFDTNNYTLPTTATGAVGEITKATLTVALIPTISKVYDRLAAAILGPTNYALGGLIGSETSAISQTVGTYATTNVGTGIAVSSATLTAAHFPEVGGFLTNNYILPTIATGSVGVITAEELILSGDFWVSNKPCDGTTTATITNSTLALVGVIPSDVVTLTAAAVFEDMNVGNGKTVYLTNSTLAGADAGNYTLDATSPTATANITTGDQTIAFAAIPAQPLTNVSLTLSATASSGLPVTFTMIDGPGTIAGSNVMTFNSAGQNTVTASQAGDTNFNAAVSVTRTFPVYGFSPTTNAIPWHDYFETYFNLEPLINGTNGWYGSSADIIVQTNTVRTGTNAAMIPLDCTLSNRFISAAATNVWLQMDVQPRLYDGMTNPVVDTNAVTMLYLNSNGNFVVHNGPVSPDATNSTNWVTLTNCGIGTNGTNWVTIGIYEDFTKTNWDLYANGILVTNNIGFVNTNMTNFAGFNVYNGVQTSYMDNVHVTAPGTVWVNPTNIVIDVQYGLVATNPICLLTAQAGVWNFTNTISVAATNWLSVNPVTGTVDAATGGTNLTVICGEMQNGSYTGIVTVSAINADGCPRTRTITVTLNVLGLTVIPTDLTITNGFMYSNSLVIPSQTFMITNRGAVEAIYTIEPQGDTPNWLSLSASGGVVAATAWTNITVAYTNGLLPGVYSGEVWVVTTDGGGSTSPVSVAATVVARPVLDLDPYNLSQTIAKGGNPAAMQFEIWNGSTTSPVVPMAYTLTPLNGSPELIQSFLDSGAGVSTGQVNSVTVIYMDISDAPTGVYTALVQVAAWDPGNNTYSPTGTVQLSTSVVVQVTVTALVAPTGVTASDGTYTDKVAVNWNPVANVMNYKVYRFSTFDSTMAEPIGEPVGTSFNDLTGLAGVRYYYWVSSVNSNGYWGEGAMSTGLETGYRGLAAPGGIFATDGAYTNKVRVTWPLVDGATGYRLYRGVVGGALAPLYFTAGGVYEDMSVVGGVHYEYKVGATNGVFGSALSVGETGYAFGVPEGLTASKGTYVGKVHVAWSAVDSASEYEVWRSARAVLPPKGGAAKMATVTTPVFDDDSVSAGTEYYYWVRGYGLEAGIGGWSEMDQGYGASAGLDLWVKDLVVLPVQVGVGGSPAIVSFRMGNGGGTNMAGVNGTVGMEFFASTNQVLGTGNEISIGKVVDEVTLEIDADMVMKVAGSQLVAPTTEGDYNIFVRVLPEYPSLLADTNPDDNVAKRNGSVRVRSSGGLNYQVFNDYDGDGMSDLGVYRGMEWSACSVDERVLATGVNVFGGAGRPVLGDLDGDRRSDPMVHDSASGIWQVLYSGSGYMWASGVFGVSGYRGLVADYEGVGHGNVSVFHEGDGRWYVAKSDGQLIAWNWGASGYEPVIGDYDGDGHWDMAVYQEATGLWYIRTLNEQLLVPGALFGGPGYTPVPGDYDGDGCWDAALYERATGKWYIASLDLRILGWEIGGIGPGFEPVMGDYDGDGKWDLAMYQEATGLWYIGSLLDGRIDRILAWASHLGGPGYRPIGN